MIAKEGKTDQGTSLLNNNVKIFALLLVVDLKTIMPFLKEKDHIGFIHSTLQTISQN